MSCQRTGDDKGSARNLRASVGVRRADALGRVRDLEQDVLHDIVTVGPLEVELVAFEEDVVESPALRGEDAWEAHFAALDEVREVDGAHARVACGPGLARPRVGCVTVRAERLSVDPRLTDDVNRLLVGEAQKAGDDRCRRDFDEDDVIQSDAVERVEERDAPLDFMCLDHPFHKIEHC